VLIAPIRTPQLLGLRGREAWLDSQVNTVYSELANATLEEDYSERAAAGRKQLLDEVHACPDVEVSDGLQPIGGHRSRAVHATHCSTSTAHTPAVKQAPSSALCYFTAGPGGIDELAAGASAVRLGRGAQGADRRVGRPARGAVPAARGASESQR
jgi:hypothetical protein